LRSIHFHYVLVDRGEALEAEVAIKCIPRIVAYQMLQSGQTESICHPVAAHYVLDGCQIETRSLAGIVLLSGS
jgi:hypothetical protein